MAKLNTKYQIPQLFSVWQHTVLILILSHLQCICPIWNCSFRQQLISRPNGPHRAFSLLLILKQASDEQIKSSEKDNQLVTWSIALCTKYKCGPSYQAPTSLPRLFSAVCLFQELGMRAGRRTYPLEKRLDKEWGRVAKGDTLLACLFPLVWNSSEALWQLNSNVCEKNTRLQYHF